MFIFLGIFDIFMSNVYYTRFTYCVRYLLPVNLSCESYKESLSDNQSYDKLNNPALYLILEY